MPASIASTTYLCFGSGYICGGLIMVSAILLTIFLDTIDHPPLPHLSVLP
ncbi:hypothetical protein AAFM79_14005 [Trichormus azollae HNT15244]